jgi:hypothetical protein
VLSLLASLFGQPAAPASAATLPLVTFDNNTIVSSAEVNAFDTRWMAKADRDSRLNQYRSALATRSLYIAWGISDDARAMVNMFEVTGDPKYLEHLRDIGDAAFSKRDDQKAGIEEPTMCLVCTNYVDYERTQTMAAWSGHGYADYVQNGGLTPVDAVTSGVMAYPMAAFARLVAERPDLQATYGAAATASALRALQTFMAFFPDFRSTQASNGLEGTFYRPVIHPSDIQCDRAHDFAVNTAKSTFTATDAKSQKDLADLLSAIDTDTNHVCKSQYMYANRPLAHNESSALMMMAIELWRALDSDWGQHAFASNLNASFARGMIPTLAARHQRYFANRLSMQTDAAQGERYTWNYNDDVPNVGVEDSAHGDLDMQYVTILQQVLTRLNARLAPSESVPLDTGMLRRFANSFLEEIARPTEIDAGGNLRADLNGRTATDRKGAGNADYYDYVCDGWINLALVDATVYRICRDVSERQVAPPPGDNNFQRYLGISVHAAILFNKGYSRWIEDIDISNQFGGGIATNDPFAWAFSNGTTRDIAFRVANTGHAYELWRTPTTGPGVTDLSGNGPAVVGSSTAYDFPALNTHNVVYRGTDNHVHGLWWQAGGVGNDDLSNLAHAPDAAGNPFGFISPAYGVQNVVYRATDGHVHGLYWSTGAVGHDDLSYLGHAPNAAGDPVAYFINGQVGTAIIYRGIDGDLHRLYCALGPVGHDDLTVASGAPRPAGEPSAYVTPSGEQNVVYRGVDGHLHGLWSRGPNTPPVGWDDLTWTVPGAPLPASDPTAYYSPWDGLHHVLYRTSNNHLHELSWTTGAVTHVDLTTAGGGNGPASKSSAYALSTDNSHHVVYRSADNHLHELAWWTPARTLIFIGAFGKAPQTYVAPPSTP